MGLDRNRGCERVVVGVRRRRLPAIALSIELLGSEAAPGASVPEVGWNGMTIAINVGSESELHVMYSAAVAAGATAISAVTRRAWGGMSAYVADPEGNRWELAVGSEFI